MTSGITAISRDTHAMHMVLFVLCVAITLVAYGVVIYSLLAHRKTNAVAPTMGRPTIPAELLWAAIPLLILIGIAIPSTRMLTQLHASGEPFLYISVAAVDGGWLYNYRSAEGSELLMSAPAPLVIPANKKIHLMMPTADEPTETWVMASEIGSYVGECPELCGQLHQLEPLSIEVKAATEFDAWLAAQQLAATAAESTHAGNSFQ